MDHSTQELHVSEDATGGGLSNLSHAIGQVANDMKAEQTIADLMQQNTDLWVRLGELTNTEHAQAMHIIEGLDSSEPSNFMQPAENAVDDAQLAQRSQTEAANLQHEQGLAVERGDYAEARDLADRAEHMFSVSEAHGRDSDTHIVQAQHDQESLGTADWQQQIAADSAAAASSYAQAGDMDHATTYAHDAAQHADSAGYHASQADHDSSSSAVTSYDSSSSDADTTSE